MAGETNAELERFRQQWQREVTQRAKGLSSAAINKAVRPPRPSQDRGGVISPERAAPPLIRRQTSEVEGHVEEAGSNGYHDLEDIDEARRLGDSGDKTHPSNRREPSSALDHYELAVERESEGSLGDSLNHYRKAYRVGIRSFHLETVHY